MRAAIFVLAAFVAVALAACAQQPPAAPEAAAVEEAVEAPVEEVVPKIYSMGIFEEPITRNFWNYFGGPGGSVWTQYVLSGWTGALFGYSDQNFEWVPKCGSRFPNGSDERDRRRHGILDHRGAY